jgi:predicted nucleic acid-binding protein
MTVLVDTSIWSVALRRPPHRRAPSESRRVGRLQELISEGRAQLLGVVRQELLSGIRHLEQFGSLREHLRSFPDVALDRDDCERAAEMSNTCRAQGVSGSSTDFLICSVAVGRRWAIYTSDGDFERYGRCLPLTLYQ